MPLLGGLVGLAGAQIMFMFAPTYWLMVIARILQGISSTVVWTVGLALLSDTCPKSRMGQHMGLAMSGVSAGAIIAPPIGGTLYDRLGWHAPFIFSLGVVALDVLGRVLVIERKDALKWGYDPSLYPVPSASPVIAEDEEAVTTVVGPSNGTSAVKGEEKENLKTSGTNNFSILRSFHSHI